MPTILLPNGDEFTGEVDCSGKRTGYGLCKFRDNSYYIGEWQNDEVSGQGKHVSGAGAVSQGFWTNNQLNGMGKITFPGEFTYQGGF
jgi:hypothetical protein